MKRMVSDWLIAIGVAVAVIWAATLFERAGKPKGPAPALSVATVEGDAFDLGALSGKVVVVNFWGSWCPPCRAEIPEFSKFHSEHPDIEMIGVAVRSGDTSTVRDAAERLGINYDVAIANDDVVRTWGVSVFPTTYVIRADGTVSGTAEGAINGRTLEAMVDEAG